MNKILPSIIDAAQSAGRLDIQVLMIASIISLCGALIWIFKDAKKTAQEVASRHEKTLVSLVERMDGIRTQTHVNIGASIGHAIVTGNMGSGTFNVTNGIGAAAIVANNTT